MEAIHYRIGTSVGEDLLLAIADAIAHLRQIKPKSGPKSGHYKMLNNALVSCASWSDMRNNNEVQTPILEWFAEIGHEAHFLRVISYSVFIDGWSIARKHKRWGWYPPLWLLNPKVEQMAIIIPEIMGKSYNVLTRIYEVINCGETRKKFLEIAVDHQHLAKSWLWTEQKLRAPKFLQCYMRDKLNLRRGSQHLLLLAHLAGRAKPLRQKTQTDPNIVVCFAILARLPYELQIMILEFWAGRSIRGGLAAEDLAWLRREV